MCALFTPSPAKFKQIAFQFPTDGTQLSAKNRSTRNQSYPKSNWPSKAELRTAGTGWEDSKWHLNKTAATVCIVASRCHQGEPISEPGNKPLMSARES